MNHDSFIIGKIYLFEEPIKKILDKEGGPGHAMSTQCGHKESNKSVEDRDGTFTGR